MFKILHLGKFFPPFAGGIENFLADLMVAQVQQGHQVAAIVHDHIPRFSHFFSPIQAESILLQQTEIIIYRVPSYGRVLYAPICPHFIFWFNQVLKQFQPQILHLHLPNTSAFFALSLPLARKIPWVIHWHSDVVAISNWKLSLAYKLFYQPFERKLLKQAQRIIATSPPYLTHSPVLQSWANKCQVIPLGIKKLRLPIESKINLWQKNKLKILTVGRLTYYKGYEHLIKTMSSIEDAQLLIVGKGELYQSLQQLITELNLENRVKLLGFCDDEQLVSLLTSCDVFCLASIERTEAFGVVLLEAMYYGKAIIATDIPGSGVSWVVNNSGLLVPIQNSEALIHAIQSLIEQPQQQILLGNMAKKRFEQLFNITGVANQIANLYAELIN
ncbi:MAG: glycosyltransferase [Thiomargarita sp.]|nr:glycosyltransferase [Thiomargarita sp.]